MNVAVRPSVPSEGVLSFWIIRSGMGPVAICSRRCSSHSLLVMDSVGDLKLGEYRASTASASRADQACAHVAITSSGVRATLPADRKYDGGSSRHPARDTDS